LPYEPRACNETQTRTYILTKTIALSTNQKRGNCGDNGNSLKVRHATKRGREIKGQDRQRRWLKGSITGLGAKDHHVIKYLLPRDLQR
jgi:hypothetical protein